MREQMEVHRANPDVRRLSRADGPDRVRAGELRRASASGEPRMRARRSTPAGTLPDGTGFEGPAGLSRLLLTKYRDDFVRTSTEKLMTYALGRGVEYYDYPIVRAIAREAARDDYRVSSLILAIVKSTPFRMRSAPAS